jgi:hypothetical protein
MFKPVALTRCVTSTALAGTLVLGAVNFASAGPMAMSSGSTVIGAAQPQVEQVRYRARRHYARHARRGYNPGPAIAGAALGMIGAGMAAAIAGSRDDYYYSQPYGYYGGPGPYGGPYGYGQPYYGGW